MSLIHVSEPVQWFEGMLLSPQHFQQNNRHLQQLMQHQLTRENPYFWGVSELAINEAGVATHALEVEKVSAVMPDGTIVQHAVDLKDPQQQLSLGGDALMLELDTLCDLKPQQPFLIYLAVAKYSEACASDNNAELKRYDSINYGPVADENDAHNRVDVVRLRTRLKLLCEHNLTPNYSALPIAKAVQSHDGSFQLLPFTPPLLAIKTVNEPQQVSLGKELLALVGEIRRKATQLRNYFTDNQAQDAMVSSLQKQRIYHLTNQLPVLEALLKSQRAKPFDLYLALLQLTGAIAVLHQDVLPPAFPEYQHNLPDTSFRPPMRFIREVLSTIHLDFNTLGFEKHDNGDYCSPLHTLTPTLRLTFKRASGVTREQLVDWIDNAYIAPRQHMEQLLISRSLGARRRPVGEFAALNLVANDDEVFVEVSLTDMALGQDPQQLVIAGSDKALEAYAPLTINWFINHTSQGQTDGDE